MSTTTDDDGCPSTDHIAWVVDGRADADSLRAVLEHASRCRGCEELVAELSATLPGLAHDEDPEVSSAEIGRYRLLDLRGAGGAGLVYRAYDPQLDREVAIKLLRDTAPSRRAALLMEARIQARIDHPNVLPVFDAGECDGDVWIATPLVEGGTLREWLALRAPDVGARVAAIRDAAAGLEAMHAAGLVHRDITPTNLLVTTTGRVLVSDLGLASSEPADVSLAGTPGYLAPELVRGESPSPRSDQFALCVVAFEALTSEVPRLGDTRANVRTLRRADVPRSIARSVARGLCVEPERRFPTTSALRRGLEPSRSRPVVVATVLLGAAVAAVIVRGDPSNPCAVSVTTEPSDEEGIEYVDALLVAASEACALEPVDRDPAVACLRQRAAIFEATLQGIDGADEALLRAEAISSLDFPGGCLARDASAPVPPAALVDAVAHSRIELARARVLAHRGHDADALAELDRISDDEAYDSYLPLRAELELVRAKIAVRAGRGEDARAALEAAADAAERGGYTAARLDAVAQLLQFPPRDEADRGRRDAYLRETAALIDSVVDPRATADGARALMEATLVVGDLDAAVRWGRRALQDRRAYLAADDPRIAIAQGELGSALAMAGRVDEAWEIQRAALHQLERTTGNLGTEILFAKGALSQTALARGDGPAAVELLEEVSRGLESAPDGTPALQIHALIELCAARASIGRHVAARTACDEALALAEHADLEPPDFARVLMASAVAFLEAAQPARALADLTRARALVSRRPVDDPTEAELVVLLSRAEAELAAANGG